MESTIADMKNFHFYNIWHMGDNLLNIRFFSTISNILKEKNIHIHYYYDVNHPYNNKNEFLRYTDLSVVTLHPLSEKPSDSIELWMGHTFGNITHYEFEKYFSNHYTKIFNILNIKPIDPVTLWLDEPYLIDTYNKLDVKYKNVDILIFNSIGQSGQCTDISHINNLAIHLNKYFNVVVTNYINDSIKCTMSDNLLVQDIAAISTNSKYIIATMSGTVTGAFNSITKQNIVKWFFIVGLGKEYTFTSINNEWSLDGTTDKICSYFDTIINNVNT